MSSTSSSNSFLEEDVTKLAKGSAVNLLGKFSGRATHLLSQVYLARLLGPVNFGVYAIGWNILRVVGVISTLGLDSGVVYFGVRYWCKESRKLGRTIIGSIGIAIIAGTLFGFLFFNLSPTIAIIFRKPTLAPVIRWFSVGFPLFAGVKVAIAATRITKKMSYSNLIEEFIQPMLNLVLIVIFFMLNKKLLGMVIASVLSFAIGLIIALFLVRKMFLSSLQSIKNIIIFDKRLMIYSLQTSVITIFWILTLMIDRLLVGYFLPEIKAGIYQSVSLLTVLFTSILGAFKMIVAPMVSEYFHNDNKQELKNLYKTSTRWGLIISIPAFLVLALAPRTVISVLFGAEYMIGYRVLVILSIAQLVKMATGVVDQMLIMTGNQRTWLAISIGLFIINLIMNCLLIPVSGIEGAATAVTITFIVMSIIGVVQVKKSLGSWPFDSELFKILLATVLTGGAIVLLREMQWVSVPLELLALSFSSVMIFFGMLLLLGLNDTDKELLSLVQEMIRGSMVFGR